MHIINIVNHKQFKSSFKQWINKFNITKQTLHIHLANSVFYIQWISQNRHNRVMSPRHERVVPIVPPWPHKILSSYVRRILVTQADKILSPWYNKLWSLRHDRVLSPWYNKFWSLRPDKVLSPWYNFVSCARIYPFYTTLSYMHDCICCSRTFPLPCLLPHQFMLNTPSTTLLLSTSHWHLLKFTQSILLQNITTMI